MIIEHFSLDLYVEISQYDNEQRYHILLGIKPTTDINELDYERFSVSLPSYIWHHRI